MYKGKATCKILKEIRKQIAKENDIAFVTSECKYQGDCLGTCPACEAEVRYLEEELRKRKQLGKTAIVTGVSLGLATSFMGCHFGGNTEETTIETTPFETAKQENTAPSESSFETETTKPDAQKQSRHHKQSKTGGEYLEFHFGGVEEVPPKRNTQPLSSDTIDITYEMPKFELSGDIVPIRRITLFEDFKDVCLRPSVEPVFPNGEDSCKKFIQQHFRISPKLIQYLRGKRIAFNFIIEENGQIGKADARCANVLKAQKRWAKRCERAVRKSIKSMPRWTPGKDQNCQPVRCAISGHIILEEPIQVWID